jgi:hypothetical protein
LPWGFKVSFGYCQTHPRDGGRWKVARAEIRTNLVHEES